MMHDARRHPSPDLSTDARRNENVRGYFKTLDTHRVKESRLKAVQPEEVRAPQKGVGVAWRRACACACACGATSWLWGAGSGSTTQGVERGESRRRSGVNTKEGPPSRSVEAP